MSERIAYSVAEAAQACNVTKEAVYQKIKSGELYAVPFGKEPGKGELRIGKKELERVFMRPEGNS